MKYLVKADAFVTCIVIVSSRILQVPLSQSLHLTRTLQRLMYLNEQMWITMNCTMELHYL